MKTVLSIELNDAQLRALASFIAGKSVKRTATRAQVKQTATALLHAVVDNWLATGELEVPLSGDLAEAWQQRAVRASVPGPRIRVAKADHPNLTIYEEAIRAGIARHGYAPGSDQAQSYARGWTVSSRTR